MGLNIHEQIPSSSDNSIEHNTGPNILECENHKDTSIIFGPIIDCH